MRSLLLITMSIALMTGCGKKSDKDKSPDEKAEDVGAEETEEEEQSLDQCGNNTGDGVEEDIRLKGVSLLARSLDTVLGPNKDKNIANADENLLATYKNNFGGNEGLGYGDTYSDTLSTSNKMTGYFMALNYVAHNAALQCESQGIPEKCRCDDDQAALSLLARAMPYQNFCEGENTEVVLELVDLCQDNYVAAISAVISSVAFAKRN